MNLPSELKTALDAAQGGPIEIVDGRQRYILVRAEEYEKLRAGLDEGTRFALNEMGRKSGWDDPSMDAYDALDPRKQP